MVCAVCVWEPGGWGCEHAPPKKVCGQAATLFAHLSNPLPLRPPRSPTFLHNGCHPPRSHPRRRQDRCAHPRRSGRGPAAVSSFSLVECFGGGDTRARSFGRQLPPAARLPPPIPAPNAGYLLPRVAWGGQHPPHSGPNRRDRVQWAAVPFFEGCRGWFFACCLRPHSLVPPRSSRPRCAPVCRVLQGGDRVCRVAGWW